jgi:FkbM family methyltransferase
MKKVYVDCGAWTGDSVSKFLEHYNDYEVYIFECHPKHTDSLTTLSEERGFTFINKGVWTGNETIPFYMGSKDRTAASTLRKSKKKKIDKENPIMIECIDFSKWIRKTFDTDDYIVCKMNIEGAEYNVLEKMLVDGSLGYIDKFFISWHHSKIARVGLKNHNKLLRKLEGRVDILPWRFVEGQSENPFEGIK